MCGSVSAVGLEDAERQLWPRLRERLRVPGHMMALMRGVLGDAEVAVVAAVRPDGPVTPLAVLTTAEMIAQELTMVDADGPDDAAVRRAKVGDYDVQVLVDTGPDGKPHPVAILTTPWIDQHLLLYARTLWHRRRGR